MQRAVALQKKLALHAPVFFLMCVITSGCVANKLRSKSVREDYPRMVGDITFSGHRLVSRFSQGKLRYSVVSILSGNDEDRPCQTFGKNSDLDPAVVIDDCVGIPAPVVTEIQTKFVDATTSFGKTVKVIGVTGITLKFIPEGFSYHGGEEYVRDPQDIYISLAFRYAGAPEQSLRRSVRTYAHELTHLADKAGRWRLSRSRGEYVASVMESCVEADVFGDTNGYGDIGDLAIVNVDGLSRAQKKSADMGLKAYEDISAFMGKGHDRVSRLGSKAFDMFCESTFSSMP